MLSIDRYTNLIAATLQVALRERSPGPDSMSLALGFVDQVANGTDGIRVETTEPALEVHRRYEDGAGHSRSLYRGLSIYARARVDALPAGTIHALYEACEPRFAAFLNDSAPPMASALASLSPSSPSSSPLIAAPTSPLVEVWSQG